LRSKKANGAINVGSDELTSFEDIINIIKNKYKIKLVKFEINKDKDPGPPIRYSNQNKLRKLGWRQKIYLNEGLSLI
jgi:nucleoside-diphosphate-sugar epimerase